MPRESTLFLKSLKEDGVEHLFLQKGTRSPKGHLPPLSQKESQSPAPLRSDVGRMPSPTHEKENTKPIPKVAGSQSLKDQVLSLRDEVLKCNQCSILVKNRTKIVFGAGNIQAKLVFVGEAPGRDEDEQGIPFVGRAGQLLTKIIEAMGLTRQEVFICNVLKCRPPENRAPAPDEVVNCSPYLKRQIELIKPKVICALGNHACQALLRTDKGISQLRGSFQEYEGIPVMCTYHPAYLLRNPAEKKKVWEDMKKILQLLSAPKE